MTYLRNYKAGSESENFITRFLHFMGGRRRIDCETRLRHYLITGKVPKKNALACDWYHLKAHIF